MLLETALADFSGERECNNTGSIDVRRADKSSGETSVGSPGEDHRYSKGIINFNGRKRISVHEQKAVLAEDSLPGQPVKSRNSSFVKERIAVGSLVSDDHLSNISTSSSFNERLPVVDSPAKSSDSRRSSSSSGGPDEHVRLVDSSTVQFSERRHDVFRSQDSGGEELHLRDEEAGTDRKVAQSSRNQTTEQFYGIQGAAVPFEWKASPEKPMVQELGSRSNHNHHRPGSRRTPPLQRELVGNNSSTCSSPVRIKVQSPAGSGESAGAMKRSRGRTGLKNNGNASTTTFSHRRAVAAPDWSRTSTGPEDVADRDTSSGYSDDGSSSSPVSTLDLPLSPISPTYCSPPEEPGIAGKHEERVDTATRPETHLTNNITFVGSSEMSEELPSVMEEDEEDLESVSGFHTIEFQTMESPHNAEDRGDWSLSGRTASSKSLSAPNSRQSSSLLPGIANRGRRRSDFDWPEDFDERPEEVVKEVDDSLWAFSPVASTFVFSGNEAPDHRSSWVLRTGVTGTSSQASSPGSGSMLDHLSLRRGGGKEKSAFSKTDVQGLKASSDYGDTELSGRRKSSRFRKSSINGDDDYLSNSGHPTKKSFSCLPFASLCGTQRPTPTISFSQRLSPPLKH